MKNRIDIENLSVSFGSNGTEMAAVNNVSLSIEPGEFVSFIGPSGCGKTTILRVIAGLQNSFTGKVSISGMQPDQARQSRSYGYVFQSAGLLPWRTVARNVALPLQVMGMDKKIRQEHAANALQLVGLEGFDGHYPWQLSGGMQQRVSIARALSYDPDILLLDEPFGALDEISRDTLNKKLNDLWSNSNKSIVFVTHSIAEAVYLSDKVVVFSARPAQIMDVIDTGLPRERDLELRDDGHFIELCQKVRALLVAAYD